MADEQLNYIGEQAAEIIASGVKQAIDKNNKRIDETLEVIADVMPDDYDLTEDSYRLFSRDEYVMYQGKLWKCDPPIGITFVTFDPSRTDYWKMIKITDIKPFMEISQEDYKRLGNSVNDDNIIYFVNDGDSPSGEKTKTAIRYYDNPDDYYNLTDEQKEAIEEIVIVNDEGTPLTSDNISHNDTNVKDAIDKNADDISTLNSTLTPNRNPITIDDENISIGDGGFYKIGNLVIVNVTLSFRNGAIKVSGATSNFPIPRTATNLLMSNWNDDAHSSQYFGIENGTGKIYANIPSSTSKALVVTGCYICQ